MALKKQIDVIRKAKRIYNSQTITRGESAKLLHEGWANWIDSLVRHNCDDVQKPWFSTFTTPYELTLPSARRAMQRFSHVLKRHGYSCFAIWFGERYKAKDGYHVHAILITDAQRADLNEYWRIASKANENHKRKCVIDNLPLYSSRSHFVSYKSGGKGGRYVAKYVTKSSQGQTDYDIIT